jgi:phosphodiesterase/alkaline phosphatase D-like protein
MGGVTMREQALVSRRLCLSLLAMSGITPDAERPAIQHGVASGDATGNAAMIVSRTDGPSRMIVAYATTDSFRHPERVAGPAALAASGFTARVDLTALPPGQESFSRVLFQDLVDVKSLSVLVVGHLRPVPVRRRDSTFLGGETPLIRDLNATAKRLAALQ